MISGGTRMKKVWSRGLDLGESGTISNLKERPIFLKNVRREH